jgi:protein-S-isoprenylcysteine O-methyltransferase Ste14
MFRVVARHIADAVLVAVCLFASAGTLAWRRAWVLLGVMLLVRGVGALAVSRVNPALLHERAGLPVHDAQPRSDRILLLAVLGTGFLGLPIIAGLDAFHRHLLPRSAPLLGGIGLVLLAMGWGIKNLALRANAFATADVRLQRERGHAVATSGPYAVVRHPFYAADPLIHVGLGLWLQSYAAVLLAAIPIALMVIRLRLEERLLLRELPGYREYVQRVPHRLLPGVW